MADAGSKRGSEARTAVEHGTARHHVGGHIVRCGRGVGKLAKWESAGYVSHVRGGRGEKVVDSSRNTQGSVSARSSASKAGQIVMA